MIEQNMNKHPEPLFQKRNFSPPWMINFANIFITPPKTFQFDLGVAGKEILTLSALYRSCQFLPLSDRTIRKELVNAFVKFNLKPGANIAAIFHATSLMYLTVSRIKLALEVILRS